MDRRKLLIHKLTALFKNADTKQETMPESRITLKCKSKVLCTLEDVMRVKINKIRNFS